MTNLYHVRQFQTATELGAMPPQKAYVSAAIATVSKATYSAIQRHIGMFRDETLAWSRRTAAQTGSPPSASNSCHAVKPNQSEPKRKKG